MQSSPPARDLERPPSAMDSEYSLDLGALDMDTVSDMELPKQKVDRIFSEDIDGPSDFTQNMELWMRGGTASRKGTLKGKKHSSAVIQDIREEELHDVQEDHTDHAQLAKAAEFEDSGAEGKHETVDSPNRTSNFEQEGDHTRLDQFSEWNAYGSASTPAPPIHRDFLQPTVEECHQELTPARHLSERSARGRKHETPQSMTKGTWQQSAPGGKASSPTLSATRSPVMYRTTTNQTSNTDYQEESRQELEQQMKQMQANFQRMEQLNEALGSALEEERRMRKQDQTTHDAQLTEAEQRQQDLDDMKEAVYNQQTDFRREFAQLKENLRQQEEQARSVRLGSAGAEHAIPSEIQRLREQLELQKLEHNERIRVLQQDLELAWRGKAHAEETCRIYREEIEAQRRTHEAQMARIRAEMQQAQSRQNAGVLEERLVEHASAESKQLQTALKEVEPPSTSLSDQPGNIKKTHSEEIARVSTDRTRAVELATDLQRQLQDIRHQLKTEQAAHEAELEALRRSQESSRSVSTQELELVRTELNTKRTELNEAIRERDTAWDRLKSRDSVEQKLQEELDDIIAVNATLDARVTEKMHQRDEYWRSKLEEANRERRLMARALMQQWGREEVGVGSPQLYAYKYLKKQSPGPQSPSKKKAAA